LEGSGKKKKGQRQKKRSYSERKIPMKNVFKCEERKLRKVEPIFLRMSSIGFANVWGPERPAD